MNIKEKMVELQEAIYKENYYINLYELTLIHFDESPDSIRKQECDERLIVDICNEFWSNLPDSKAIRRPPFLELCDIAEQVFYGEDDE